MNWTELYNAICYMVWGIQAPPEGALALLQGQYGVIATIHHNIQKNRDYWFMEYATTIAVVAGTAEYAQPLRFKHLVKNGLRFIMADGNYDRPLTNLVPGDYSSFREPAETADYPQYYEIYGDNIVLSPMPKSAQTLHIRYYKYLDRPPAVFDATSDALTINGCDVIKYLAAAEVCIIQEDIPKAQIYKSYAMESLAMLDEEDAMKRRSGMTQIRCGV